MRLHRLALRAVGPFADEQVVDFDRLSAGGLFLLEGPTGVGKSTILDALTFALYGGLASDIGDPARLRSHFASPDARPEVQLEFTVRGQRHRLTRSPEFARPKRRGDGVTVERSSVHLEREVPGGGWHSRSHAKDEVGTIVSELLGLNRQQFRQVVLLPQGEFATFLRAGDDERREVLGRLFDTACFSGITAGLQERAASAARARQEADSLFAQRLAAAWEAAGLDVAQRAGLAELRHADRVQRLGEVGDRVHRQVLASSLVVQSAEADAAGSETTRVTAQSVLDRVGARDAALGVLAEAAACRAEREQLCQELARARRAAPLAGLLDFADDASTRLSAQRAAVVAASRGQPADPRHLAGQGAGELARAATDVRSTVAQLGALVPIEEALPERRVAIERHEAEHVAVLDELQQARLRAESLPHELADAHAERDRAQAPAAQWETVCALLASERERAAAADRLGSLEVRHDELGAARRGARRALDEVEDHEALLGELRLADARGEMAASLVSGDPCLVCGSREHPAPARTAGSRVTPEALAAAARARDHARLQLDEADRALLGVASELAQARAAAAGRTSAQWARRVDELEAQAAAGEAARGSLADLQQRVTRLMVEQAELGNRVAELEARRARLEQQLGRDRRELVEHAEQVDSARDGHCSVGARAASMADRAEELEALASAVHELQQGMAESRRARDLAAAEAGAAGFRDLAGVRSAMLPPERIDRLARDVERWDADIAQARARLASDELSEVADVDEVQAARAVALAEARHLADERRLRRAREEHVVAERQRDRFTERLVEVHECFEHLQRLATEHDDVAQLDQYVRGMAGTPRMTLVTFVLRYWFEQVVAAANLRLDSMSAGKYELLRVDRAARRTERVGLGLAVLDRHTGQERSTATLSGGETFYTSLALALGLVDVVVARAGGAMLDTLFIDEGFGSLDPDTLDDVMGVIDDLRGSGRVVGIVSHVPELKERVAERLTVRRARPDGPSHISIVA